MPDGSDEKISVAPIIVAIEAPCLSDLSERDKPWDKHRSNTDKVSAHYRQSEFSNLSDRTFFCSDSLDFKYVPGEVRKRNLESLTRGIFILGGGVM